MTSTATNAGNTAIEQIIAKFTAGDPTLFEHMAPDIDFRIDHYRDDTDVSWQAADNLPDLMALFGRLAEEVFPKGTKALEVTTTALGNGWHLTRFQQQFFYGVRQCDVTSATYITSHEADGLLDYFRETVTTVDNI
ncbi:hypothetical protein HKX54_11435 [Sulfitobacter sp. M57]|uniref:hypothetical protein n=1 Tax=unclassified Sulfitobacter TaxID=196795 RepID=UPI0023E30647|nr:MULTISPECIES: hypothetical protein [unclassified Sulfitobacter]MDF3415069.1 hypothetical protein [Sulfitobacter sp. KE5]MDF3422550.1 hypothetical protein [Sulfitobacter sp. KE43]MDF3433615.1 hypothetical protein [Sulfitobacter sp. KE42]MDF3459255.1 hypothetical protein [Sulfitobacter sp. S74]MDF3463154.1 hypothetical protein [Sulfitobacter sp. Ks18]